MMRQLLTSAFLLFIFFLADSTQAQTPAGHYTSGFRQQGNDVFFSTTNAEVKPEFCSPAMFRVRTSWTRQFAENEPYMVVKYTWAEAGNLSLKVMND